MNTKNTKYIYLNFAQNLEMEDVIVHIRFERELHEKIKAEAKKLGMPLSTYIKMIVLKNLQS